MKNFNRDIELVKALLDKIKKNEKFDYNDFFGFDKYQVIAIIDLLVGNGFIRHQITEKGKDFLKKHLT